MCQVEKFPTSSNFPVWQYLFYQRWKVKIAHIISVFFVKPQDKLKKNGLESWEFLWERTSLFEDVFLSMTCHINWYVIILSMYYGQSVYKISVYFRERQGKSNILWLHIFHLGKSTHTHAAMIKKLDLSVYICCLLHVARKKVSEIAFSHITLATAIHIV